MRSFQRKPINRERQLVKLIKQPMPEVTLSTHFHVIHINQQLSEVNPNET
jgi:hypothetical protein